MTDSRPVAGYCRISIADDTSTSVAAQRQIIERWAEANGHEIEIYTDDGFSGSRDIERPALNRMLADIDAGAVQPVIVVKSVDRLGRRLRGFIEITETCRVVAAEGGLDTGTPTGRLMLQLLSTFAEFESQTISQRQATSQAYRRRSGRATNAPGLGYRSVVTPEGTVHEIDEEGAVVVREIVARVITGDSLRSIALDLNDRGIRTRRGNLWQASQIRQLVQSPHICGMARHGDDVERGDDGLPLLRPHLALVSVEDWHLAQEALAERSLHRFAGTSDDRSWAQGLASCAGCGGGLVRAGLNRLQCPNRGRRTCPSPVSIQEVKLEEHLAGLVEPLLDLPATTTELVRDQAAVEQRLLLQREIDSVSAEMSQADTERIGVLAERLVDLRHRLDATVVSETYEQVPSTETLRDWWERDPQLVIRHAMESIVVDRGRVVADRIHIIWRDDTDHDA